MNWRRYKPLLREELVTVIFFTAFIFTFGIFSISRWTIGSRIINAEEKRWLAAFPHVHCTLQSIEEFPNGFNAFYNDRFAFRKDLISVIDLVKYHGFACSTRYNVLIGKKDWLYFFDGGDEETLRGYPLLTHAELENWVRVLEARRAWLAARNIRYIFIMPPSKCTVYREYTPTAYTLMNKQSRQDQLLAALKTNSRVEFLDIRPVLLESKKIAPVFYKTDTHWNSIGAFAAYEVLTQRLEKWFPNIKPLTTNDLNISRFTFAHGDIASMMGLYGLLPEFSLKAAVKASKYYLSNNPVPPDFTDDAHHTDPFATEIRGSNLPRGFCLRDSFMQAMQYYLSQHFSRMAYYWRYDFPTEVIEKEKPDIVIQEITERMLARGVPHNPPEVNKCAQVELVAGDSSVVVH